jgi:hypothetical protein
MLYGGRRIIPLKKIRRLKFHGEIMDLLEEKFKLFEDCKTRCPLFAIIESYMRQVAEDGKVDFIRSQKKQIRDLNDRIRQAEDEEDFV